jgi:phosphatidate phosphatase APP1
VRRALLALLTLAACVSPEEAKKKLREGSEQPAPAGEVAATAADQGQGDLEAAALRSPIRPDEEVILFPTAAWLDSDANVWRVPLHGWIYEPEQSAVVRRGIIKGLDEILGDDDRAESEVFKSRVRPFLYDNESGKHISIRIGKSVANAAPSTANGHFVGAAEVPRDVALRLAAQRTGKDPPPLLRLQAVTQPTDRREFEVDVFLVPASGLTIISDVDDTVKITEVTDRKKLVRNTFFEPFRAVPGMAAAYARWLREASGGHLHFVSSSPWQLYTPLVSMLDTAGFPPATFDLKQIRLRDPSVADLFSDPMVTKPKPIEKMMRTFPRRQFALIGDSGEKDPEVYGKVARAHPEQVVYIAIRNVTGEDASAPRYADAFRDVKARWEVFTDPAALSGPP